MLLDVIPAKVGIQIRALFWIPALLAADHEISNRNISG
jgi:hypothetical protein